MIHVKYERPFERGSLSVQDSVAVRMLVEAIALGGTVKAHFNRVEIVSPFGHRVTFENEGSLLLWFTANDCLFERYEYVELDAAMLFPKGSLSENAKEKIISVALAACAN